MKPASFRKAGQNLVSKQDRREPGLAQGEKILVSTKLLSTSLPSSSGLCLEELNLLSQRLK